MRTEEAVPPPAGSAERVFRLPDPRRATRADWTQLLRFCAVGGSGYVVNLLIFTLLVTMADTHYATAALGAFVVAWTNNFFLNKYWTFKRGSLSMWNQAARYLLVSVVALGLNEAILHVLVQADLQEIGAQALAIMAVTPVSFLLTRRWAIL